MVALFQKRVFFLKKYEGLNYKYIKENCRITLGAVLPCSCDFINKIKERSNNAFFQPNRLSDWSPGKLFFLQSIAI